MRKILWENAVKATPSPRQMQWQQTAFYGLVHFGMNTFTDSEWGSGGESPELYAPEKLSVHQWVRVAKNAGMRGLVLTVKHYDGFCLWPSRETEHTVEHSPCPTDVVGEMAKYCAEEGLKFGVRIALWDRHDLRYGTGDAYNKFLLAQLRELLTQYGELFGVWLDDTCGEGKNGRKQAIPMKEVYALIRSLQPNAVIGGCGPDVRFSGNYVGFCRRAEWSAVPYYYVPYAREADDVPPPRKYDLVDLELGTEKKFKKGYRALWYPAEVVFPMRKGWFYHESEKYECKALSKLIDTWYAAVGGNANFMLGVSPDKQGRICEADMQTLLSIGAQLSIDFAEDLAQESKMTSSGCAAGSDAQNVLLPDESFWQSDTDENPWIEIDLLDDYDINKLVLREAVSLGQRIEKYSVFGMVGGKWKKLGEGGVIGARSICRFPELRVQNIRVVIEKTRGFAALQGLEAY